MPGRFLLLIIALFTFTSCKQNRDETPVADAKNPDATYFSIKGFVKDQWDTYKGQPFGIEKKVYLNGKTDSSMLNAFNMEWGEVFKLFFDTDISDKKFLGQYDFTMFEDNSSSTRNFYYEAKDKKLYTRKLQITADVFSNKIKSVYIEAADNTSWNGNTRKLFYIPIKVISIQEFEKATMGPDKELRIEYRFL